MAIIPAVRQTSLAVSGVIYKWETETQGDTCAPCPATRFDDPTISAFGTFGTTPLAVAIQGSPEVSDTPALFHPCSSNGTAISITASGEAFVVDQLANYYKPVPTSGDGTSDVDIFLVLR